MTPCKVCAKPSAPGHVYCSAAHAPWAHLNTNEKLGGLERVVVRNPHPRTLRRIEEIKQLAARQIPRREAAKMLGIKFGNLLYYIRRFKIPYEAERGT